MRNYVIYTDSCADLTPEMYAELGLRVTQLDVIVEGEEPVSNDKIDPKQIYALLRSKKKASTAAVNIDRFLKLFQKEIDEGNDILYLAFSSALSGTYQAGTVAMAELQEKYPDRKLYTVDTRSASMGQGLLVYYASKLKESGADIDAVRAYAEDNKRHLCHWFTVDDLFFLKRGGRVSAATAAVGSLLNIKPVLHMDDEGRLINVSKARGRRAAIHALFDNMKNSMLEGKNPTVFISHGDCIEDAVYLADRIRNELHIDDIRINYVGPVIGSHSGPGTLALFFMGKER